MVNSDRMNGVFAAAVTPLRGDLSPDLPGLQDLLSFLARRGCHGALLLGTTGEGPSFSPGERNDILRAARQVLVEHPGFRLVAGTGTPSLEESVQLTRTAFELGYDAVLVLPPYYYRKASEEGLYRWFSALITAGVPSDGQLLAYHIPGTSGVDLSLDLLERLKEAHPNQFAGLKDSSGDPDFARALGGRFGTDLAVLTGNDRLLPLAIRCHAAGCITALANIWSPDLRRVWNAHNEGQVPPSPLIDRLRAARATLDRYAPAAPTLKAVLAETFDFPEWSVKPPLLALPRERATQAAREFNRIGLPAPQSPSGDTRLPPGG